MLLKLSMVTTSPSLQKLSISSPTVLKSTRNGAQTLDPSLKNLHFLLKEAARALERMSVVGGIGARQQAEVQAVVEGQLDVRALPEHQVQALLEALQILDAMAIELSLRCTYVLNMSLVHTQLFLIRNTVRHSLVQYSVKYYI